MGILTTPNLGLPYPDPDENVDVPTDIGALALAIDGLGHVPPGAMLMWPGSVAPSGWLLCLGQTNIPAASYPALAALLGQTGGMVNMPNMKDVFPVGAGGSYSLGTTGGEAVHKLIVAEMPAHSHVYASRDGTFTDGATEAGARGSTVGALHNSPLGSPISTVGGDGNHNNLPPYRAINFIIKAG